MKKFIIFALTVGWFISAYSQERVIQLEETELTFAPTAEVVFEDYSNGVIRVKESYGRQFESNAVKFLTENFDIHRFIEESGGKNAEIRVVVKSSNGMLSASYDGDGNLLKTYQKFQDIPLPPEIRNQVFAQYKNWTMTTNKYIAYGSEDRLDREKYHVYLENGNKKEKLKITPSSNNMGVATIEK